VNKPFKECFVNRVRLHKLLRLILQIVYFKAVVHDIFESVIFKNVNLISKSKIDFPLTKCGSCIF